MRPQNAVLLVSERNLNFMPKRKVGAFKNILSNFHSDGLESCGYAQAILRNLRVCRMADSRCSFADARECWYHWQAWCIFWFL